MITTAGHGDDDQGECEGEENGDDAELHGKDGKLVTKRVCNERE
jgi:hypothetical protein